jgi:tripartite-type tricarboxylate transporter receptor subunit TctC
MNGLTRRLILKVMAAAALTNPLAAFAEYPGQPVKMVVGYAPGGTTDVIARIIGQELSERLGKAVIVENRPGASGIIGAGVVAKARPDGQTLLMVSSMHATAPALYKSMPYDTHKDLVPVSLVATTPYVLVVHPSIPARNFSELITLLKQNPGKYAYASSGPGSAQHLAGEMLQRMENVSMVHVPYKGSGAILPDLLPGRVPMTFENVAIMTPLIKQGAVRPIAVTGAKRTPLLPDVPTVIESGLPGFEVQGWFGVFAPTGTPPDVIKRLNKEINNILGSPAVMQHFAQLSAEPLGGSPEQLDTFLKEEEAKWGSLIKEKEIKLQ